MYTYNYIYIFSLVHSSHICRIQLSYIISKMVIAQPSSFAISASHPIRYHTHSCSEEVFQCHTVEQYSYLEWRNFFTCLSTIAKVHLACVLSLFSHDWLCDPMDGSPPDSSVHGILQARILEWVPLPSSREYSWTRDWTHVSYIYLHWQAGSLLPAPPGKQCTP